MHYIEMNHKLYKRLRKEFLQLEMGESDEVPREKKSYKEGKEAGQSTKEKFAEGIKVIDMITTLKTLIRLNPAYKEHQYNIKYSYEGAESEKERAKRKIARKVA